MKIAESEMQLGFSPPFDVMAGLIPIGANLIVPHRSRGRQAQEGEAETSRRPSSGAARHLRPAQRGEGVMRSMTVEGRRNPLTKFRENALS